MQYKYADEGSPLAAFITTFHNIVTTRKVAASVGMVFGFDKWKVFVDDLQMLFEEGVTIGIRTAWVRRVLIPVLMAQRHLQKSEGTEQERARGALEILQQLRNADDAMLALGTAWVTQRFLTEKSDVAGA